MRHSLVDLMILTACMVPEFWGALRTSGVIRGSMGLTHPMGTAPALVLTLFVFGFAVAVGIAVYLVLGSVVYRVLGLLPLRLPICPHCGQRPHGYRIPTAEWPRMRVVCSLCGQPTDLWWHRPGRATLDQFVPNLLLTWPQVIGRWRLIADAPSLIDGEGLAPLESPAPPQTG